MKIEAELVDSDTLIIRATEANGDFSKVTLAAPFEEATLIAGVNMLAKQKAGVSKDDLMTAALGAIHQESINMNQRDNYERSIDAEEEAEEALNDGSEVDVLRLGRYVAQENMAMRERALHAAMHPALPPRPLPEVLTDAAAILKFLQTGEIA